MSSLESEEKAALAAEGVQVRQSAAQLMASGDLDRALGRLEEWIERNPRDPEGLAMLAHIAHGRQQFEDAAELLQRAAEIEPSPQRLAMLVQMLQWAFDPAAALVRIDAMPEALRRSLDLRLLEALLAGETGDQQRELAIFEVLLREHSANPSVWLNYATALKGAGQAEAAIAAIRRAIEISPGYGEAFWALANLKSHRFSGEEIAAMQAALGQPLNDFQLMNFHFALAVAFEQHGQYDQAFRHFDTGNRMHAVRIPPALMSVTPVVESAIATLTPKLFEQRSDAGFPSDEPIFVIGLHRSGSTLIEQILASHPLIEGTSELKIMPRLFLGLERKAGVSGRSLYELVGGLDAGALRAIGAEYVERSRAYRRRPGAKFVDKLPGNWLQVGLIRLALPNARIIDARRHPLACGLSNFRQNYGNGMSFSYSQRAIGVMYRDYLRLMDHMDQVQPGSVHHVIHERLIEDFEGEVRRLLDFVGVPFHPDCLEFHLNRRAVRTPSAEQVRRPLNREGAELWRHYEQWLDPLKQALGPALAQWDKPASTRSGTF